MNNQRKVTPIEDKKKLIYGKRSIVRDINVLNKETKHEWEERFDELDLAQPL